MLTILAKQPLSFASTPHADTNPCEGAKPADAVITDEFGEVAATIADYFDNRNCSEMMDTGYNVDLPQAGMDVTDYDTPYGLINTTAYGAAATWFDPILVDYSETDLCPVNIHWHKGSEHKSLGQFDEDGTGPHNHTQGEIYQVPYAGYYNEDATHRARRLKKESRRRRLAETYEHEEHTEGQGELGEDGEEETDGTRLGMQCHHYDESDAKFTTLYDWQYCKHMEVGQTYEVHWPHSAAGACGTDWQYQYPFYDGVFCTPGVISLGAEPAFNVNQKVGVEGQVFVIVNSEEEQYQHDLLWGAWKDESHWVDVAKYIGSTTGTTRDNEVCSMYAPITWQVDRTCHLISAQSFDELCRKMLNEIHDDLYEETHPHGARELVIPRWASDELYNRK
jgi:hypothetical protein